MHSDHVTAANMRQQGADGDLVRRNRDVDQTAFDQVDIGGSIDQRHDLLGAHALGQHRRQDIGFVVVGEGAKHVHRLDILFQQQVGVGGVAEQDDGRIQHRRQLACPFRKRLDHLDLVVALHQPRELPSDIAAAGEHDALVRLFQLAHFRNDGRDVFARGEKENLVAGLDDAFGGWLDRLAFAKYRRHAHIDLRHNLAHGLQLPPHHQAPVISLDRHQLYPALGKIEHLHRARMLDQVVDVVGNQRFRADHDVYRDRILGEQSRATQVFRRANARDLGWRVKNRRRDLACDHIDLVTIGQRDQHVGIVGAGIFEQPRVGAVTANRAQIQPILQFRQNFLVGVDYGYFVALFPGELRCDRRAYLPGPEDNYIHGLLLFFSLQSK